ncbi:MAG: hypothetical protein ACT4OJ_03955 [Bacteroidota bacterium]
MKFLVIYLTFVVSNSAFSQTLKDSLFGGKLKIDTNKTISIKKDSVKIGETGSGPFSEIDASFPQGQDAWMEYLTSKLSTIADSALKYKVPKGTYLILTRFIINKDGSLLVQELKCNPSNEYIEERCKAIFIDAPKWSPAYQNGRYVKAYRTQPFTLRISKP